MPHLPAPDRHPADQTLRDDVRWLADELGHVIRRFAGEPVFDVVEALRRGSIDRRRGATGAPDLATLRRRVADVPLAVATDVARAFTLFFLLINTAEQVQRARRNRQREARAKGQARAGSTRWALEQLRRKGHGVDEVAAVLGQLELRPVLTAHPTEATRRTVLSLQARVARGLLARTQAHDDERQALEHALRADIELLWLTSEVRHDRPQVLDEVATALWYLEDRLFDAGTHVAVGVARDFEAVYGAPAPAHTPLSFGSWVGGDRDGNPFVTAEITLAAARRNAYGVIRRYRREVRALVDRISLSASLAPVPPALRASLLVDREELPDVWSRNGRRDADEPVRLKLSYIEARLDATMTLLAARDAGEPPEPEGGSYASPAAFEQDLRLVEDALVAARAEEVRIALLHPLLTALALHGFAGFRLDVRQDADVHERALEDIAKLLGAEPFTLTSLQTEILGRRPLVGARAPLGDETAEVLDVFDAMATIQREIGHEAACSYIVSMASRAEDLLRVLLLARHAGLADLGASEPWSRVDVVPLFETGADLAAAPRVLAALFQDAAYARQLEARGRRQRVMIGYSDSSKDVGVLPAAWALYRAQEAVQAVARAHDVQLVVFHGQGGTVGRGGGSPVLRATAAFPPGTARAGMHITEQGEVVSQKYGLEAIAERSLEVALAGALLAAFDDWRERVSDAEQRRFVEAMDRMADVARPWYRRLVHEETALFHLFKGVTPVDALRRVHFGSRPAYRPGGSGTMAGIRAIPWVFGWTQIRLMVPGWLGAGRALTAVLDEPGGEALLRRMARKWPFFADLLGKIEMVCAKTDPEIARMYVETLGGDVALAGELIAEHERAVAALLRIRQRDTLLGEQPRLQTALSLREGYLDPLSLIQVELMQRHRTAEAAGEPTEDIERALGGTLNGIAQGLRNTA